MALARKKPPIKRKMMGLAKGPKAVLASMTPIITDALTPKIPVIKSGREVKSQLQITQRKIARNFF
jgi:hypothetical protein